MIAAAPFVVVSVLRYFVTLALCHFVMEFNPSAGGGPQTSAAASAPVAGSIDAYSNIIRQAAGKAFAGMHVRMGQYERRMQKAERRLQQLQHNAELKLTQIMEKVQAMEEAYQKVAETEKQVNFAMEELNRYQERIELVHQFAKDYVNKCTRTLMLLSKSIDESNITSSASRRRRRLAQDLESCMPVPSDTTWI